MIDIIPFAEVTAIRTAAETAVPPHQRTLGMIEDEEHEADGGIQSNTNPKASKLARELTLETEASGYNSGRTYRVHILSPNPNSQI